MPSFSRLVSTRVEGNRNVRMGTRNRRVLIFFRLTDDPFHLPGNRVYYNVAVNVRCPERTPSFRNRLLFSGRYRVIRVRSVDVVSSKCTAGNEEERSPLRYAYRVLDHVFGIIEKFKQVVLSITPMRGHGLQSRVVNRLGL